MIALLSAAILGKFLWFWFRFARHFAIPPLEIGQVAASLATVFVFLAAVSLLRRAGHRIAAMFALSLAVSALTLANLMFFDLFGQPITPELFFFANRLGDVAGTVALLVTPEAAGLFLPDLLLLLPLAFAPARARLALADRRLARPGRRGLAAALAACVALAALRLAPLFDPARPFTHPFLKMLFLNPVNYYAVEAVAHALDRETPLPAERLAELEALFAREHERRSAAQGGAAAWFAPVARPNILVLQMESLRMQPLRARTADGAPVMPALERLMRRGIAFPNFHSQVFCSADSDYIALASLYGVPDGVLARFHRNGFDSLPALLKRHGWSTHGVSGGTRFFWYQEVTWRALGLDRLVFREDFPDPEIVGLGVSDRDFYRRIVAEMKAAPEPWFFFAVTSSNHHPFRFPDLPETIRADTGDPLLDDSMNAAHYADRCLGEFVGALEAAGLFDNLVILLYGDHTIKIPAAYAALVRDHPGYAALDGASLHLIDSNVPCLLLSGALRRTGEIAAYCGQIDVAPTLADLCGLTDRTMFLGDSLFGPRPVDAVVNKVGIGRDRTRLFSGVTPDGRGFARAVRLADGAPLPPPRDLDLLRERMAASADATRHDLRFPRRDPGEPPNR